jgi:PAS domain S-box-containing protein
MPEDKHAWQTRVRSLKADWLQILVFALLCSLTFIFWRTLESRDESTLRDKVEVEAGNLANQMEADLRSRIPTLQRIAGRWEVRGGTPKKEFLADAEAYLADMGGFQAIGWADRNFVVRWVAPVKGNEQAINLNLSFEQSRRRALEKAKKLKSPTATAPVDLVQGGKGFLVYVPIYTHDEFQGFVLAVFRIQEWIDFVFSINESSEAGDYRISVLFDDVPVYWQNGWDEFQEKNQGSIGYAALLDHQLAIRVQPTRLFIKRSRTPLPSMAAGAGLLLSSLVAFIVHLFRNVSAKAKTIQRANAALEKSEERFRLLLDSTAEGIYGIDLEGNCSFANPSCLRMLGYPDAKQVLGKNMHSLCHHSYADGRLMPIEECHIYRAFKASSREHREDEVLWRADGTSFPAEYWSYPQLVDGRVVGAVVTFNDITERKQATQALAAASRELEARVEERTRSLTEAHNRLMEQRILQRDLEIAGQVQSSLLSAILPAADGFDFGAFAKPSRYVNGDFYDCQLVNGTYCSVMLADIAGKGMPAALFASSARALYRLALNEACGSPIEETSSPQAILQLLNSQLFRDLNVAERFITMIAARLNLGNGLLEVANAGGCKVIVLEGSARASRVLESGALPIGILPELDIEAETVGLRPGMGVIIYSDGLTEAVNPDGELFGLPRLLEAAAANSRLDAANIGKRLIAAIESFQGDLPLSDDATIIVIKAKPRRLCLDFVSSLESLDEIPARVAFLCSSYGEVLARDMQLAVSEALSNIWKHGYDSKDGPVSIDLRLETRGVELLIREKGKSFDLDMIPTPPVGGLEERGRGIFLMREVMDDFSYQAGGSDGNLWILFKSIEG